MTGECVSRSAVKVAKKNPGCLLERPVAASGTVAPFWQNLVLGLVIIGAVLLNDTLGSRIRKG